MYVDDSLLVCKDIKIIEAVKQLLLNEFGMMDVGKVNSFLGMQIEQDIDNGTITLSQSKYLEGVLRKFGMQECKPKSTPMEKGLHMEKGDSTKCSNHSYRELKLVMRKDEDAETLVGYSDSGWGGDKNDSKSTSGYVFRMYGNTVSWASRKQPTVSLSSTEAEYVALVETICEGEWIKKLLMELKVSCNRPIPIYEDNTSCIKIAESAREYKRMKHLNIKYDFIKDMIAEESYRLFKSQQKINLLI